MLGEVLFFCCCCGSGQQWTARLDERLIFKVRLAKLDRRLEDSAFHVTIPREKVGILYISYLQALNHFFLKTNFDSLSLN